MPLFTPLTVTKLRASTGWIVMLACQFLTLIRNIEAPAITETMKYGPTVCMLNHKGFCVNAHKFYV